MTLAQLTDPPPGIALASALAVYVLAASVLAFAAFRDDKRRAIAGDWRLTERFLLLLAALGGWPGAKLAQHRYRHKTRKEPFRRRLNRIGAVQLLVLVLLALPLPHPDWIAPALQAGWAALAGPDPVERRPHRTMPHRFGPGATMP